VLVGSKNNTFVQSHNGDDGTGNLAIYDTEHVFSLDLNTESVSQLMTAGDSELVGDLNWFNS